MPNLVLDPWSFYDYKITFERQRGDGAKLAPSWVDDESRRRLLAYVLLESYCKNCSREWLDQQTTKDDDRRERREYGDPNIIVETARASLLGDDLSIVTPEAGTESPSQAAKDYHKAVLDWATKELLNQKIIDCERKSTRLGDAVYVLNWNKAANRVGVTVYDPGFYFPVLDAKSPTSEYPLKVHIAWEYLEGDDTPNESRWVKRCTWELRPLDASLVASKLPWNDKPKMTCWYSEMVWKIDALDGSVEDFAIANGQSELYDENGEEVDELDLALDFIPVVHIPNTVAGEDHFGTSVLAMVMQIFDDLSRNDTDLAAVSLLLGTPPVVVSGTGVPRDENGKIASVGPGAVWETGDGTATLLDTSKSLDALLKREEKLLDRLSVNGRTPGAILGRVKPNEVPSGITLTLGFTPHSNMIKEMRMVRDQKYELLFKMVGRMHALNWEGSADNPWLPMLQTKLKFGSFLPSDISQAATIVAQLYRPDSPMISLETAVALLVNAGYPIESAADEVERIVHNDFKKAAEMLDATADINESRKRLGLGPLDLSSVPPGIPTPPGPTPPTPPTPPKPPVPPAPPRP